MKPPRAKHDAFALHVASGMSDVKAYQKVFKCSRVSAEKNAWRLRENDGVKARIAELHRKSDATAVLTMQERRQFMARVKRVNLHNFDPEIDGDLIDEITIEDGKKKFKLPSKRGCIMDDAKLAGELIDKAELTGKDGAPLPSAVPEVIINYLPPHIARPRIPKEKA